MGLQNPPKMVIVYNIFNQTVFRNEKYGPVHILNK